MRSSENCNVKIYNESGDFEGKTHDYDDYLNLLIGTKMIYIRKSDNYYLICASGVICSKGKSEGNSFFFYKSALKTKFLLDFFESVNDKCIMLGLSIEDKDFKDFFKVINDTTIDVSNILEIIDSTKNVIKIVPTFHIPKNNPTITIEKIIENSDFQSVGFNFINNEIQNVQPDILFNYGNGRSITPTKETERYIEAKDIEQLRSRKKDIDFDKLFYGLLRKNVVKYCHEYANDIEKGGKYSYNINLLNQNVLKNTIKDIQNYLDGQFKATLSKRSKEIYSRFSNEFDRYYYGTINQNSPNKNLNESDLKKVYQDLKQIFDINFDDQSKKEDKPNKSNNISSSIKYLIHSIGNLFISLITILGRLILLLITNPTKSVTLIIIIILIFIVIYLVNPHSVPLSLTNSNFRIFP